MILSIFEQPSQKKYYYGLDLSCMPHLYSVQIMILQYYEG